MGLHRHPLLGWAEVIRMRCSSIATEIQTGAKTPARPSEHHHTHTRIDPDRIKMVVKRLHHLSGHRVELVRAIQSEQGDALNG